MCARRGHAKKHAGAMISLVALLAHQRGASLGRGARALFQLWAPQTRNIPEVQLCDKVFIKATRKVSTNLLSIMASGPH